jgi:hypothetical protein
MLRSIVGCKSEEVTGVYGLEEEMNRDFDGEM